MKNKLTLASTLILLLAGCGGGGGGSSVDVPVTTTDSIFSDPVPMQCEVLRVDTKTCNAPTSSYGSTALIQAALTDPQAGAMKIKAFGTSYFQYSRMDYDGTAWVPTAGALSHDGSEEEMVLSPGSIQFQGKTYAFDKTYPFGGNMTWRAYCIAKNNCIYTVPSVIGEVHSDVGYGNLSDLHLTDTSGSTGGLPLSVPLEVRGDAWDTYLGLLTDRMSVSLPASERITYSGLVYASGGDGSPLGKFFNGGPAACPIELILNTRNGEITTTGADCTGTDDGSTLSFSLKTVFLKKSEVRPGLLADSALVSGTKMYGRDGAHFLFSSTKIAGGMYGNNAQVLTIFGSGMGGFFHIVANRLP